MLPKPVKDLIDQYQVETPGIKEKLVRLLMHGQTAGTGKVVISAVDQGFEHGPIPSFAGNFPSHDPLYHFDFAYQNGLSALAGPLGFLEVGAAEYAGLLPLILKVNSSNILAKPEAPTQAMTASIEDAVRLGCIGVGFTIYPGSNDSFAMFEELRVVIQEARAQGLITVVWSYPRGELTTAGETAVDVVAYGAHIACLLGAHIVKVKIPTPHIENSKAKETLKTHAIPLETTTDCVRYIVNAAFMGKRMVIFSGGTTKGADDLLTETQAVQDAGGHGSIIGRNIFQRPMDEAITLVNDVCRVYKQG